MQSRVDILAERAVSLAASSALLIILVINHIIYMHYVVDKPDWLTTVVYVFLGIAIYGVAKDIYKLVKLPGETK